MHVSSDPISRPGHDSASQITRGMFVTGGYLSQVAPMAQQLQGGGSVGKGDLLTALEDVQDVWQARPESDERTRALERISADRAFLATAPASDLAGLAGQLEADTRARTARLENAMLVGLGVALVAACTYMSPILTGVAIPGTIQALCGGSFLVGAFGAAALNSVKERPPQLAQLGRLYVYADAARQSQAAASEVTRLADALSAPNAHSVSVSEKGVVVGGVLLPRRRS